MSKTTRLFPFIPGRAEWAQVPFAEAQAYAVRELGSSANVTFTGASDTHFHFSVRGRLEFTLPRAEG